jgi:acyl-coenzyme A thioesterase PaaI-like protein
MLPENNANAAPNGASARGNCFGCAEDNPKGLRMIFHAHDDGSLVSKLRLGKDYESFPGIVHGGIVATVMDEAMGRAVLDRTELPSVTVGMRVRYAQVMRSEIAYRVIARATRSADGLVYTEAELRDEQGALTASGTATFLSLTAERVAALEPTFPQVMVHSIRELEKRTRKST